MIVFNQVLKKMKVTLVIDAISSSGGTKTLFQYARLLHNRGHEATILTKRVKDQRAFALKPTVVSSFDPRLFPSSDIIIATKSKDVLAVGKIRNVRTCHLCQGFEIIDLDARIDGEVTPPRYQKQGLYTHLLYQIKKLGYKRKKRTIDSIYRLKTHKIAVSKHLKEIIEARYGQKCYYVPNGIDLGIFSPKHNELDYVQGPIRIICVGSFNVTVKGIDDVLNAVRLLKIVPWQVPGKEIISLRLTPVISGLGSDGGDMEFVQTEVGLTLKPGQPGVVGGPVQWSNYLATALLCSREDDKERQSLLVIKARPL